MKYVLKGNRQLTIADEMLDRYLNEGYSEIDSNGKVVQRGVDTTPEGMAKERKRLEKANAKLEKENEALKAKLSEAGLTW